MYDKELLLEILRQIPRLAKTIEKMIKDIK